ncbi:DUF3293 domain-containing protein [Deinococcus sp. SDU3-2]|uniref:DUF3293 domain-containing protein n=2 Tax=Deinococcus terrestris TaxID=2651870 RepID=A0A7X1NXV9_9DEIO|nr:DUF3293 domain-containing protein [Deinococcus terrestris]
MPGRPPSWAYGPWAIVTAWNPAGKRASDLANAQAHAALLTLVQDGGFTPMLVINGKGEWAEAALLIHGARLWQAAEWGSAFGQAAVLWGDGARAALVWLDGRRVTGAERRWLVVGHG